LSRCGRSFLSYADLSCRPSSPEQPSSHDEAADSVNGAVLWVRTSPDVLAVAVPFSTGWLGRDQLHALAVVLYGLNLLFCAVAYYMSPDVPGAPPGPDGCSSTRRRRHQGQGLTFPLTSSASPRLVHPVLGGVGGLCRRSAGVAYHRTPSERVLTVQGQTYRLPNSRTASVGLAVILRERRRLWKVSFQSCAALTSRC